MLPSESCKTPSISLQHIPRKAAECGEVEKSEVNILACTSDLGEDTNIFCNVSCRETSAPITAQEKEEEGEDEEGGEGEELPWAREADMMLLLVSVFMLA